MVHVRVLRPNGARGRRSLRAAADTVMAALALAAVAAGPAAAKATPPAARSAAACPWVSSQQPISQRVAEVVDHMSLADEITMVEGHGTTNPYVFYMPGIPDLCIPALGEEDGPNGVADKQTGVTQLPAGVALAATFDPALARQYGRVIGAEEWGKGAAVNLGPTVNIDRDPRWGRSFESFTEDPFLNSALAVSEINGVQSQREMSQVKHYDVYNQETNRNLPPDNAIVSERVMHEIYMPAFQAAVKQANVASLMCAYSMVNGAFACDNGYLLNSVLKERWGFGGFVTSDYGAIHATSAALEGTDQEQPESTYFGTPLAQAVSTGQIPKAVLNTMVSRMLTEMFRFNLIASPPTGTTSATVTSPAHVATATRVADASATLLRNAGGTLPLSRAHAGNVAVIGPAASTQPVYGGGGSAAVIPSAPVTPLQGLQAAAGPGTHISYTAGLPADASLTDIPASALSPAYAPTPPGGSYTGTLTAPETGTFVLAINDPCGCYAPTYLSVNGTTLIANPATPPVTVMSAAVHLVAGQKYTVKITGGLGSGGNPGGMSTALTWATPSDLAPGIAGAVAAAKSASRAVVVVSDDVESEAADRPNLQLPSAQNELVSAVEAANPHTIVVVDAGAPVAMPWLHGAGAVLDAWFPGQVNGTSLADVLFGRTDPGGHLPVTFPRSLAQVPASTPAQFPGTDNRVLYSEGLDVGYRWYDAKGIAPLFPFGFGLSYTHFRFSRLRVVSRDADGTGIVRVAATVTNTGRRAGGDVAQLYLADPRAAGEPPRQLVGFQRVSLAPGARTRVTFTVTPRDTWWWDRQANGWSQSPGVYRLLVGDSSALADLPLRGAFLISTTAGARQVRIHAPHTMHPGQPAVVRVWLTRGGTATLRHVRLALQLPQGFRVRPVRRTVFGRVPSWRSPVAVFRVTPPRYAPAQNVTMHATVNFGRFAQRETGVAATVS
ncbi:MAG TPA: glycoside hydrolase family 3 C-terminal domain-containing protein [Solirubrobacteraceae bacterium]|nr:glycoside hydrolase family 3 C-terminal domain-containing protein [Solirubrobacteraceae bacterium]